jgi:hypothetical protein
MDKPAQGGAAAEEEPAKRRTFIDWRFDAVALAALILSLFAAFAQVLAWASGPSVKLITPDRVGLYLDMTPDQSSTFVRVAADMSYANVAQAPYGTLVVAERVILSVAGVESRQRWNAFGTISRDGVKQTGTSAPQALPGQSAVTHFTLFTPVPVDCPDGASGCDPLADYLTAPQFANALRSARELRFQFQIELIGGKVMSTSCTVPLKQAAKEQLAELLQLRTPYFYATCHPTDRE